MGVSIYVMDEDGRGDGVDFAYSGLQRLRQMAIIATMSYLRSVIDSKSSAEPTQKKVKTNPENGNDNDNNDKEKESDNDKEKENSEKESSESDNEENSVTFQLTRILNYLETWTTTKKAEPLFFDSTQHSIFDLLGQFKQMMPIDYNKVSLNYDDECFARHNLTGLWKFVVHSDSDGVHSYGDCVDIHELFTKIIPHLNETEENDEWFKSVAYVFEMAVESKNGIRYS